MEASFCCHFYETSCHQSIINLREGFEIIEFSTMLESVFGFILDCLTECLPN